MQYACAALYCHLWPVRLFSVFPHYLINGRIFRKKQLNTKYVFWFSLHVRLKHFSFYEKLIVILLKMYIALHVKYVLLLPDFSKT